ncbi:conjugal transfer protein TraJ [Salmonella enterica subsp. enterica serovar Javiana]|nr:conjugal transfer protein TraJ [Salmonella enterica subsp. enterica serovar Javiana]
MLSFKKKATKTQWKVFLLYVYGFKHSSISEFLLIENGVSRNIVLEINKFFNVGSKHSLQVLFYNSKFSDDYLIDLRKIISDTN